ncbi:MAG: ABC transporter permease [Verrucomicrobiaceae bacterium]|nr:MAG: ABC transporter permease [Verrucomicrobiaceae bacterium]
MKYLGLIWSTLKRKKLRSVLTLLSIFVAFLLFGILCIFKESLTGGVSATDAARLVVRHKVSFIQLLPESYTNRIRTIPGVSLVGHQTWFNGMAKTMENAADEIVPSFPVDPEMFMKVYPEFILPADRMEAWRTTRTGAVVGKTAAEKFKWKVGDHIQLTTPLWPTEAGSNSWEFDIVGIYTSSKKNADLSGFLFHYDYFEEMRGGENKSMVGWFGVRVDDPQRADAIAKKIDDEFANSTWEVKAEPEGAMVQGFIQQFGDIASIIHAVLSMVFFTILLIAGNTMSQAVRERFSELGVLKAMGFPNGLVLMLVFGESCTIALLGGLTGLAVAWVLSLGGSPVPSYLPVWYMKPADIWLGVGLALLLGLVTGAVPAIQAFRLRIAEALRRDT